MTETEFMTIYMEIVKHHKSPVVNIDASKGEVIVPREFIDEDGTIQVAIGPQAVRNLRIADDIVYCRVTFQQRPFCLSFPLASIIEIFEDTEGF